MNKRQILKEDKERTCKLHTARPEARTTNSPASERPQPAGGLEPRTFSLRAEHDEKIKAKENKAKEHEQRASQMIQL